MLTGGLQLPSVQRSACPSPCPSLESLCPSCVRRFHVHVPVNERSLLQRERRSDEASQKMLVNVNGFNNRLPAHGSESKLHVSITEYYTAHIKTRITDNTHRRDTISHTSSAKLTRRLVQTHINVFQMLYIVFVGLST